MQVSKQFHFAATLWISNMRSVIEFPPLSFEFLPGSFDENFFVRDIKSGFELEFTADCEDTVYHFGESAPGGIRLLEIKTSCTLSGSDEKNGISFDIYEGQIHAVRPTWLGMDNSHEGIFYPIKSLIDRINRVCDWINAIRVMHGQPRLDSFMPIPQSKLPSVTVATIHFC
jgi:hypothetical protein